MLIEHSTAHTLAEVQLDAGLELAYLANEAHTDFINANAAYAAVRQPSLEERPLNEYAEALDTTRSDRTAYGMHFQGLQRAAGELVGRTTLGGDFLELAAGNPPVFYNDGSYTPDKRI